LVLCFNNRSGKLRHPLSLALSEDGGATWPWLRDLELDADTDRVPIEATTRLRYSYPALAEDNDGGFDVAYTFRRRSIKHVGGLSAEWIKAGTVKPTVGEYKGLPSEGG
jgi:predicted neuraminidase